MSLHQITEVHVETSFIGNRLMIVTCTVRADGLRWLLHSERTTVVTPDLDPDMAADFALSEIRRLAIHNGCAGLRAIEDRKAGLVEAFAKARASLSEAA